MSPEKESIWYFGYINDYKEKDRFGTIEAGLTGRSNNLVYFRRKAFKLEDFNNRSPQKGDLVFFKVIEEKHRITAETIYRVGLYDYELDRIFCYFKKNIKSNEDKKIFINKLVGSSVKLLNAFKGYRGRNDVSSIVDLLTASPFKAGYFNWDEIRNIADLSPYAQMLLENLTENKELEIGVVKELFEDPEVILSDAVKKNLCKYYQNAFPQYCVEQNFDNLRSRSKFESNMLNYMERDYKKQTLDLMVQNRKDLAIDLMKDPENVYHGYFTELEGEFNHALFNSLKADLDYIAFDLLLEGADIKSFAFLKNGSVKPYENIEQIGSLGRRLSKTGLIVGYDVKSKDLDILKRVRPDAFVWDTLEVEMLLDPQRYSYSLRRSNSAEENVRLIDDWFWNQLHRLLSDPSLRAFMSSWIPGNIFALFDEISKPEFAEYFSECASRFKADESLHSLSEASKKFVSKLRSIGSGSTAEKTLVVAPKCLWGVLANYLSLSFYDESSDFNFRILSGRNFKENDVEDKLPSMILERFLKLSKTPVAANLSESLKAQFFSQELLSKYVADESEINTNILCCDLAGAKTDVFTGSFKHIYFIGTEVEDRSNLYFVSRECSVSDLFGADCYLPMKMAGTNCMFVTEEERDKLALNLPQDVGNVWVERMPKGNFKIKYNLDYQKRIDQIKNANPGAKIEYVEWDNAGEKPKNIFLARPLSNRDTKFDISMYRVNSASRYRYLYWTFQVNLLRSIHENESDTPMIYIIGDAFETENVEHHAKELGFYVSEKKSLIDKLLDISKVANGLLAVSEEQFSEVLRFRDFSKYVYVLDNMSVDESMIMWNDNMFLNDAAIAGEKEEVSGDYVTPKNCMLAMWPNITFLNRFIKANNPESKLYVTEPYFDDYEDLAKIWNVDSFDSVLWENDRDYESAKEASAAIHNTENSLPDGRSVEEKMEIIRKVFIPNFDWHDYQREPLKKILEKEEDCLISIPTGGGKSILFQGPALYNSAYTNRLSLVVTPLKALMQDQVYELHDPRLGFYNNVDCLNSDLTPVEIQQIYRKILSGEMSLLYVTPERFRSEKFIEIIEKRMENDDGLEYFIFDEAHCISQWGFEFRPDYLNVVKVYREKYKDKYKNSRVIMFSATVTEQIHKDIEAYFGKVRRLGQTEEDYNPIRSHIGISFKNTSYALADRYTEIANLIKNFNIDGAKSRVLVFCRTKKQCEECSEYLSEHLGEMNLILNEDGSSPIDFFHGGMDAEEREDVYQKYKSGRTVILCATKAFGMGMDIPNIHYIIHLEPPSVLEDYLQEVGRAGRNRKAYEDAGFKDDRRLPAVCLYNKKNFENLKSLISQNSLSWEKLELIRKEIVEYYEGFRGDDFEGPVVVPQNLLSGDDEDGSDVNFALGLFWLEKIGRIKTGFRRGAFVNVSLTVKTVALNNDITDESEFIAYRAFDFIRSKFIDLFGKSALDDLSKDRFFQVFANEIRSSLSVSLSKTYDALINCALKGWLKMDQSFYCAFTDLRFNEIKYKLQNPDEDVAIDVIFDSVANLTDNYGKEFAISYDKCEELIEGILSRSQLRTKKNEQNSKSYMIWHDENTKSSGISLEATYRKDLKKRAKHIITTLKLLPNVKIRPSFYKRSVGEKIISINDTDACKRSLEELRSDCLAFLRFLDDNARSEIKFGLIDCLRKLKITHKGYDHFNNIIRLLRLLGYIKCENIFVGGLDVYVDDKTFVPLDKESQDKEAYDAFEKMNRMRDIRLKAIEIFMENGSTASNEFISDYFKCNNKKSFEQLLRKYYRGEKDSLMAELQEDAIKNMEENELGDEQKVIYNAPIDENINILAGPGSGKTRVLTFRCARLIYRFKVDPSKILVLAYNRAVIIEVKDRLETLFKSLGLGNHASKLNVYTFDALARKICGRDLDSVKLEGWEIKLLDFLRKEPSKVRHLMPGIEYILIDEFQDITQTRVDAMKEFKTIYPNVKFFTVGDKNQSIYGFDKKISGIPESIDPQYYYKQLEVFIDPKEYKLLKNYRSYPEILNASKNYLKDPKEAPAPCEKLLSCEPEEEYVRIVDCEKENINWYDDLPDLIEKAKASMTKENKDERIENIAAFFRTNNEVYLGYELVSKMNCLDGVRIRIQGASECELYRIREIYEVINYLKSNSSKPIVLDNFQTQNVLREYIESLMANYPNWDRFYLDFAYTLILDYLDEAASDEQNHVFGDLADFIMESCRSNDGQIYKIYDKYEGKRIERARQVNLVLTTMHKIKGLEFDAVVITPSYAKLPFGSDNFEDSTPNKEEMEEIEEERRLQYVAYTRAKKILWVYKGAREFALDKKEKINAKDLGLGYSDSRRIEKFYLSYLADASRFKANDYIRSKVKRNDPLLIYDKYVLHNRYEVGFLSTKSEIRKLHGHLSGLFVNEIYVWTYEETLLNDEKNGTNFAEKWSPEAINQGYIYIVDFAGYAKNDQS
ncbi:DEAD/DEAH box helicase [bacterium]|nr:DEAD/DEAH box helicase [bacterium]MBP5435135.1 DEAD/DEAH box helicase [bacterium]